MKRIFAFPPLFLLLLAWSHACHVNAQGPLPSAKELAGQLSTTVRDGSSIIRLKLEGGKPDPVLQLQIKSRRTPVGTDVLYQILWPRERKGEGFLLKKNGSGSYFKPTGAISPIPLSEMDQPVFGSGLSYSDLVENFYSWEQQAVKGPEVVDRVSCIILESKPGGGDRSNYGLVRSWIDAKRLVPLRVEKYNKSNQLVRRITTTKVAKDDTRNHVAASFTVQQSGQTGVTALEGSNSRHDVTFQDTDFTPEALRIAGK